MERNNTQSINPDGLLFRPESRSAAAPSSDFVLQWGNRKRLRCMKVQAKDHGNNINKSSGTGLVQRATARTERRVVWSDLNHNNYKSKDPNLNQLNNNNAGKSNGRGNGYLNLRQPPASPSQRVLRNSESSLGMRGHSNGVKGLASPDRDGKKGGAGHHHNNKNSNNNNISSYHNDNHYHHSGSGGGGSGSSEMAHDGKRGGSSSGCDAVAAVWPPKFVISLTNKEKEEDFMAIKGSKLPQRPKKRAKFIQRTLNLTVEQSNFTPYKKAKRIGRKVITKLIIACNLHCLLPFEIEDCVGKQGKDLAVIPFILLIYNSPANSR